MIDLYFWPTGNGKKIIILLEELGLPYTIKPINIGRGDRLRLTLRWRKADSGANSIS
jgi:GST-like protein